MINCPSKHSATVEEEILLRELEIFVSSSLETLEMLEVRSGFQLRVGTPWTSTLHGVSGAAQGKE